MGSPAVCGEERAHNKTEVHGGFTEYSVEHL